MRDSVRHRAAFGLLGFILLSIGPLFFYRGFPSQFRYSKVVLTEVLVIVGAVALALWRLRTGRHTPVFHLRTPVVLLALAVLASSLASPQPAYSLVEAQYFLCGLAWLWIVSVTQIAESSVHRLALFVTIGATTVAAIALLQWIGTDPLLFGSYSVQWRTMVSAMRVYSTFGNPNFVSGYLIGAVFLALALAKTCQSHPLKVFAAVTALAMLTAIAGTRSRGGAIGLAAGVIVAWVLLTRPLDQSRHVTGVFSAAGALFQHFQGRVFLWRAASPMFTQHPLLGSGWGTFSLRFPELQARFLATHPEDAVHWTFTWQLHNDPLQILCEAGAAGFIAWMWLLWRYSAQVSRVLKHASSNERIWLAGSAAGVTAILVDGLLNFQFTIPPTFILMFTLMAVPQILEMKVQQSQSPSRQRPGALRAGAGLLVVVVAVFLLGGILKHASAEHLLSLGLERERSGDNSAAEGFFREGLEEQPSHGPLNYALARVLYRLDRYEEAQEPARRATRTVADAHLEVLNARIQDFLGHSSTALEGYRRALRWNSSLQSVPEDIKRLSEQEPKALRP